VQLFDCGRQVTIPDRSSERPFHIFRYKLFRISSKAISWFGLENANSINGFPVGYLWFR
jgi:hypothetical protein